MSEYIIVDEAGLMDWERWLTIQERVNRWYRSGLVGRNGR